nr:hypothetical protein [Tanacetum cinerariifolium]
MAGLWFRMFKVDRIEVKCYNCNGIRHIARNCTQPKRPHNSDYFKDKILLMQAQENEVALDEEKLLFLIDDCDTFDSDVDEAPMAQTMCMANLSYVDPVYDEAGPSYDSDILSEVAIGYKNPLCLIPAKQVQPALYNGHEIIKDNHVSAFVHNTEDTLEIAEITRRKMNDKIKDPECVNHKALTKEIKETKDVFEELEAEVGQNVVDRKHDKIEQKNLLIANENLIVESLSKEVFYVATNYELNVARFTEMHVANTIVEARCLELEAELSNLRDKSHNDNYNELVNRFSNLEHYKELYDSIKITCAKHIEQVTVLTTKNVNLKAQILHNVNSVSKDHVTPTVLAPRKYAIDVEPILRRLRNNREAHLDYLRHLKESVETIRDILEEAKVVRPLDSSIAYTFHYTKHSQELLEYAIGTCPQDSHQRDKKHAPAPLIRKKQVTELSPS